MLDKRVTFVGFELDNAEREKVNSLIEKYLNKNR
jgi:hypothetical protein